MTTEILVLQRLPLTPCLISDGITLPQTSMRSANYGPTQPLEANNFHLVLHCLQYILDQIFAIHQYKDKDTFQERAWGISGKTNSS